jgi:hypothetical protein
MEAGLEVNAEKTSISSPGQKYSLMTTSKSFRNVTKFKYFGVMVTNQNYIHEKN